MQYILNGVFGGCESYVGRDGNTYYRCMVMQGMQSKIFGMSKEVYEVVKNFKLYNPVVCYILESVFDGKSRFTLSSAKMSQ